MKNPLNLTTTLVAAAALLAVTATVGNAQVDVTGFNTVTGFAGTSTGAFNINTSPVGHTAGFQNGDFGGFLNDVYGIRSNAGPTAARSVAYGWGNFVGGVDSYVHGTWTGDGSNDGVFMFSDHDPNLVREAAPFIADAANRFFGLFNNGYDFRTEDGNTNQGLFIDNVGDVSIGEDNTVGNFQVVGTGDGTQGIVVIRREASDGTLIRFRRGSSTVGTIDVLAGIVTYNAFTGSHYALTNHEIERGMLVSLTGENGRLEDNPESEILYGVAKTSRPNDPSVMGSYLARQHRGAADLSQSENPHLVAAVGNGEMWVVDTGKNLAAGDYLVSSAVSGHAMTDPGTFDVGHIVGRVAEPVDWENVTETVTDSDGVEHKRARVSVFYESFVIDRSLASEMKAELAKLRAENKALADKVAALDARDKARDERLARLERALDDRAARTADLTAAK